MVVAYDALDGFAYGVCHIGGDKAVGALLLDGDVASQTMNIHAESHAPIGRISLGNECRNHTREHITTAGSCQARVARAIDIHLAVGAHRLGVVALEHDSDFVETRHIDSLLQAVLIGGVFAKQAVELAIVRRKY